MKQLNHPATAILALAAFLFLAKYSYSQPTSYTHQQVRSVDRLVERVSKPVNMSEVNARKMVYLFNN